jgi:Subunit CCDC53 of WASH complex
MTIAVAPSPSPSCGLANRDDAVSLMKKIQTLYEILPAGWSKNTTNLGSPPFVHDDGRVSWKHPARDEMNQVIAEMAGSNAVVSMMTNDQKSLVKRYRRMLSSGVPAAAVEQRARLEGVDPVLIYAEEEDADILSQSPAQPMKEITNNNNKPKMMTSVQMSTLKRFEKMIKAGIPIKAVQQAANVQGVDISELTFDKENDNDPLATCHFIKKKAAFEPGQNQVSFHPTADLTRLVGKLVQTISKRSKNNNACTMEEMTVELRVLYHALGSLRGVQHSRNIYNSTTTSTTKIPLMESRSKRKPFLELASSLGMPTPSDWKEPVDIEGLDDLVQYIETAYQQDLHTMDSQLGLGLYDFGALAQIYKPGTRVVATNAFCAGVGMICEVAWNRYEEGRTLFGITRCFKVCFQFVVAVGKHFTMAECVETMEEFEGKRSIHQLSFIPLAGYSAETAMKKIEQYEERGRLYNDIATMQAYMEYDKGSFYGRSTSGVDPGASAHYSGGRLMVDTQGGYENGFSIGTGYDPMVMGIKYMYKEYMLQMRAQKDSHGSSSKTGHDEGKMILFDSVPDEYLAMTWPALVGFSFLSKVWGDVLVDGLKHIQYQEDVFDKIVLPPARKRMVKALVKHSCDSFNDVVRGKGEGSVFLLYGVSACFGTSVPIFG